MPIGSLAVTQAVHPAQCDTSRPCCLLYIQQTVMIIGGLLICNLMMQSLIRKPPDSVMSHMRIADYLRLIL